MTLVSNITGIKSPCCDHGPTLLFEDKSTKNLYYACAASRDREFCSFRISFHKWKRNNRLKTLVKDSQVKCEYSYLLRHPALCGYCLNCCRVLITGCDPKISSKHYASEHDECKSRIDVSQFRKLLPRPCYNLLKPLADNANLAQYYFSKHTLDFICDYLIRPFNFDRILCIGCPTSHEKLLLNEQYKSFLLDMDSRHHQFYEADKFARFNMFNGHFFDHKDAPEALDRFTATIDSLLIIIDPPFGGLIECLARIIHRMCDHWTQRSDNLAISIAIIFPYFNEHWIRQSFDRDQVRITDFIVTYDNHSKFNAKKFDSQSPVRVFTNLELSDFSAVDDQLYRWCPKCSRTVFRNNQHCNECGECTARDATKTYHHCSKCQRCVKANWTHCTRCNCCHLPNKHKIS